MKNIEQPVELEQKPPPPPKNECIDIEEIEHEGGYMEDEKSQRK